MRGTGRALLAATLLVIAGALNLIYGIGALDNANIFANDRPVHPHEPQHHGVGPHRPGCHPARRRLLADRRKDVRPRGRDHRRQPRGIGALLSVGSSNPWWSLGIFFLCLYIVHGIFIYGEDERALQA